MRWRLLNRHPSGPCARRVAGAKAEAARIDGTAGGHMRRGRTNQVSGQLRFGADSLRSSRRPRRRRARVTRCGRRSRSRGRRLIARTGAGSVRVSGKRIVRRVEVLLCLEVGQRGPVLADLEERRRHHRRDAGPVAGRLQHRVREYVALTHQTRRSAPRRMLLLVQVQVLGSLARWPRADSALFQFQAELLKVSSSFTEEAL